MYLPQGKPLVLVWDPTGLTHNALAGSAVVQVLVQRNDWENTASAQPISERNCAVPVAELRLSVSCLQLA
jgi:hypothetical protein